MQITYRNLLLLSTLLFQGCFHSNPSHQASMTGKINTQVLQNNDVCFYPDLNSIKLSGGKVEPLPFVKFSGARIYQGDILKDSINYYRFKPNEKSFKIDEKSEVCLKKDNLNQLDIELFKEMKPGIYKIEMYATHPYKNTLIRMYGEFEY